jgi:hypothetical protein
MPEMTSRVRHHNIGYRRSPHLQALNRKPRDLFERRYACSALGMHCHSRKRSQDELRRISLPQ